MTLSPAHPLVTVLTLLALAGCVTEVQSGPGSRGVPVRPGGAAPTASDAPKATLPDGPVATPAVAVTSSAAVRVTFFPAGSVPYDGATLPLVSPDGKYLAVQSGEAPTWPTLLAEPAAEPVNRTTITVFDVSGPTPSPMNGPDPVPGGLMLGRAADGAGFLVESPQRDGSRWIGRVAWGTGNLQWLAKDGNCNAHGVLTGDGSLLFTRRAPGATEADLVLVAHGKPESVRPAGGETFAFPMAGDDPSVVYACRIGRNATDLEAIRVRGGKLEGTVMRRLLGASADPLLAHQVAQTSPGPASGRLGLEPGPLVLYSPRTGCMAVFDLSSGVFEALTPKSVAAARSPDPLSPGYFCTTPEGLAFVPKIGSGGPTGAGTTVIGTQYVPRLIAAGPEQPSLLLVGPVRQTPDRLELVRMILKARTEAPGR